MLRLYNSLTRQEEPFAPERDNTVRMYACGPTVYARAHIGNFRTFVCLDVLRRTLKYQCGYAIRRPCRKLRAGMAPVLACLSAYYSARFAHYTPVAQHGSMEAATLLAGAWTAKPPALLLSPNRSERAGAQMI